MLRQFRACGLYLVIYHLVTGLCLRDEVCETFRADKINAFIQMNSFVWLTWCKCFHAIKAQAQFHSVAGTGAPPLFDQDSGPT